MTIYLLSQGSYTIVTAGLSFGLWWMCIGTVLDTEAFVLDALCLLFFTFLLREGPTSSLPGCTAKEAHVDGYVTPGTESTNSSWTFPSNSNQICERFSVSYTGVPRNALFSFPWNSFHFDLIHTFDFVNLKWGNSFSKTGKELVWLWWWDWQLCCCENHQNIFSRLKCCTTQKMAKHTLQN